MLKQARYEIYAILTTTQNIALAEGQVFYETPETYELWDETEYNHPRYITRFRKINVTHVSIDNTWIAV